ncbi:MAG: tetratricopeptide repeat protein [Vicinamibacterales bacterium]|nr:tetratricopeptide repeat protein [Vicinamibacterales bacterium]
MGHPHGLRVRAAAVLALALLVGTSAFAQDRAKAAARARSGWEAVRAGRHQRAAEAFEDAIRITPRDPSLHFGAGLSAWLQGQAQRAQQELREALVLAPEHTEASLLLGEVLYRGNDLEGAIQVYEQALLRAPAHAPLVSRLEEWRKEAELHRDFYQAQGSHFTVLFEGPADEPLAAKAVELLEQAYWRIGAEMGVFPDHIITVVLATRQQFRDITRSPDWAAAAFDGRIKIPVSGALRQPEELDRILAHEFTHALIRSIAPRSVPTWLNEGLAVALEPGGVASSAEDLASRPTRLPAARLTSGFAGLSGADARAAYAQSATAVQFLIDRQGLPAVVSLLHDIARGEPFPEAFANRMLMAYPEFLGVLGAEPGGSL